MLGIVFRKQLAALTGRVESVETPLGGLTFQKQADAIAGEAAEIEGEIAADIERGAGEPVISEDVQSEGNAPDASRDSGRASREFDELLPIAQSAPIVAVMGAWRELENALSAALPISSMRAHHADSMLLEAARTGLLPDDLVRNAHDLRELRNHVAHGRDVYLTAEAAISYILAARRVTEALALAGSPQANAARYEKAIHRSLLQWDFPVAREDGDRGYDFRVGGEKGLVGVEVKYRRHRQFGQADLEMVRARFESSVLPVVLVTNASLSQAVLSFNSSPSERGNTSLCEIVQWQNAEHDDVLVRALLRAGVEM
ncbi:hypothetical protein [Streptomyces sp. NBC_01803]|uniref:hypothetical protein n=1 Tax=Streptomyces sp. NBC_01803 TaxID=2975946 RepID=UPI002DDC8172|nr:hypothetical protein [Streptomyces sp. NBC_01803]WSA45111.1 hypothetical protein OIE51_13385 [Streptomyces sp. NBC_01803]